MTDLPGGPRRGPDDDDWESRLPDDWEPIEDPRPKHLFRVVAVIVAAAMLLTAAPLLIRVFAGGSRPVSTPEGTGVVTGIVVSGPQCPVVTAESPCPDKPVSTDVIFSVHGEVVASTRSDDDGRFGLSAVPPGTYTVVAGSPDKPFPRGVPVEISVREGYVTEIELRVDTGIR